VALQDALPEISRAGASLVVISPQVVRAKRETGNEPVVTLEVLRDEGNRVARRYGIVHDLPRDLQQLYAGKLSLDLGEVNGDGTWSLPMPARFVIDRNGIIRSVATDPDYRDRPDPAATLEALRRL
jgi:peroxiredoxin